MEKFEYSVFKPNAEVNDLLKGQSFFYEEDNDIVSEIELEAMAKIINEKYILDLMSKYNKHQLEYIFSGLWKYLTNEKEYVFEKLNRKVIASLKKFERENAKRIFMFTSVDRMYSIGVNGIPFCMDSHNKMIEKMTQGGIVIVGAATYQTDWFNSLNLDASEIRVLGDENYDGISVTMKSPNHKFYTNPVQIITRPIEDNRIVYIIGGEKTYKKLLQYTTDIYATYVKAYIPTNTKYFTEIPLNNFSTREIIHFNGINDNFESTMVHLKLIKGRRLQWRENKNKYDNEISDSF